MIWIRSNTRADYRGDSKECTRRSLLDDSPEPRHLLGDDARVAPPREGLADATVFERHGPRRPPRAPANVRHRPIDPPPVFIPQIHVIREAAFVLAHARHMQLAKLRHRQLGDVLGRVNAEI